MSDTERATDAVTAITPEPGDTVLVAFEDNRDDAEHLGAIHRALTHAFPDVSIVMLAGARVATAEGATVALLDLRDRLVRAEKNLRAMAGDPTVVTGPEHTRLRAKAEGVALALSYLDETIR